MQMECSVLEKFHLKNAIFYNIVPVQMQVVLTFVITFFFDANKVAFSRKP